MTGWAAIGGLFGLGRLPFGGWVAAALAVPLVYLLHRLAGFPLVAAATVALAVLAFRARGPAGAALVADRMVGQMLALWALSAGLWLADVPGRVFPWPGWTGGFVVCQALTLVVFRRLPHLWDDLAAGATATAIVLFSAALSHGWLG